MELISRRVFPIGTPIFSKKRMSMMIISASAVGSVEPRHSAPIWWNWTQAPLLGTLGAKHGAGIEQLCRSGALLNEIMLNDGTHNARRAFGAKRKLLLRFQFGIVAFSKRARL